jgi:hypothetical protein
VATAKARLTVQISEDCLEEARDAVIFLRTRGVHTTLTEFVEAALLAQLERERAAHDLGERFPKRSSDLPAGRPLGA